jgi:hypothetical protein
MGITTITNLMPLPPARVIGSELEPVPTARVENSARTGDETYSPSNGKSARGSEDDGSGDELEELIPDEEAEPETEPTRANPASKVSFFV